MTETCSVLSQSISEERDQEAATLDGADCQGRGEVIYILEPNSTEWMDAAFLASFLKASLLRRTLVGKEFTVEVDVARMWMKTEAALSDPSHRMVEVAFYNCFAGYQLFEHIEGFATTCADLSWTSFNYDEEWPSLTARATIVGARDKVLEQWEAMLKRAVVDTLIEATTKALQAHLSYCGKLNSVSMKLDDQHDSVEWKVRVGETTYVLSSLSIKHMYDALCRGEDVPRAVVKMLLSAAKTTELTVQKAS